MTQSEALEMLRPVIGKVPPQSAVITKNEIPVISVEMLPSGYYCVFYRGFHHDDLQGFIYDAHTDTVVNTM